MFKSIIAAVALIASSSTFAAIGACPVKDVRVCEAFETVQAFQPTKGIIWKENSTSAPTVAAEYEWAIGSKDVIHLGDTKFLDDDSLLFLIAHELGHSKHGHGRQFIAAFASEADQLLDDLALVRKYAATAMDNAHKVSKLNHQQEFEADEFAVKVMLANGKDPVKAMKGLLKNRASSSNHPSRKQRLDRAEQFVAAYRNTVTVAAAQ